LLLDENQTDLFARACSLSMDESFIQVMGYKLGSGRPDPAPLTLLQRMSIDCLAEEAIRELEKLIAKGQVSQAFIILSSLQEKVSANHRSFLLRKIVEFFCDEAQVRWDGGAREIWKFCGYYYDDKVPSYQDKSFLSPALINGYAPDFTKLQIETLEQAIQTALASDTRLDKELVSNLAELHYVKAICSYMAVQLAEDNSGDYTLYQVLGTKRYKKLKKTWPFNNLVAQVAAEEYYQALLKAMDEGGYPTPQTGIQNPEERREAFKQALYDILDNLATSYVESAWYGDY